MSDESMSLHPRPDFNRGQREGLHWLDLNGRWDFCFEPHAEPDTPQDPKTAGYDRRIRVPFPWQSHLAWGSEDWADSDNYYSTEAFIDPAQIDGGPRAYRDADQYEVGWYRRTFRIPESWSGRHVILNIGAADWQVAVWCNQIHVGTAESAYLPVQFDLAEAIAPGDNDLIIRVFDPMDHGDKPVGKQWNWYTRTSGIWQPVWLEPRPERYIKSLKLTPDVENGAVFVCAQGVGVADGDRLQLTIRAPAGAEAVQTIDCEDGWFADQVELEETTQWTPSQPALYDVTAALVSDEQQLDEVQTYFGLRSVSAGPLHDDGPNYVQLNGEPIYLRGALDQSFNPWGVYAWPGAAAIKKDVELAKQAGLNFLRLHIKLEDPRFLYWCDSLGMLLQCDLPNFGEWSQKAMERHERMLRAAIDRDFNHPSIFSWCLFNETWGLGGEEYKQLTDRQDAVADLYDLAQQLDPTRLIEDNSPCRNDHVVTDINSWHFYINDYERARQHIASVVDDTYPGSDFNYVPGRSQGREPLMNSEYGGIAADMGDMDVSWCFKFLTTELRKYEQICGYVYTELQDIEWERNGIYKYDRSPKYFGYAPARLQRDVFVGFDCAPAITVAIGDELHVPAFVSCMQPHDSDDLTIKLQAEGIDTLGESYSHLTDVWHIEGLSQRGIVRTVLPDASGELDSYALGKPGLVALHATVDRISDAWNSVIFEVRDGELPDVEKLDDGRSVIRRPAGGFEESSRWSDAEIETGTVDRIVHLAAGRGHGHFDYRFDLSDHGTPRKMTILFEASSARPGVPQTSDDTWPTDLSISINGIIVYDVTLPDQPADYRGCLSHMHGFDGRYGRLVRVQLAGERLQRVLAGSQTMDLRLQVAENADNRRGLTVYSSRAGSIPCDVTLIIE